MFIFYHIRYGDPLNPDGDLEAMNWMKRALYNETTSTKHRNRRGVAFISIPIGSDLVVWNLHRIYGRIRLPKMLEGWEVQDKIGWDEALYLHPSVVETEQELEQQLSSLGKRKRIGISSRQHNFRNTFSPVFVLTPKTST